MDIKIYENIIEKKSKNFSKDFFENDKINTISVLTESLNSKLYDFKIDDNKIRFLSRLKDYIIADIEEHKKTCKTKNCRTEEEKLNGLFVLDQELNSIYKYYKPEVKEADKFTSQEISEFNSILNEVLKEVRQINLGNEILFNEIDELRDYLKLGKKTTKQLIYGKFKDIAITKAVEDFALQPIYNYFLDKIAKFGIHVISNL